MDFIKAWFSDGANKTGCRFITVDAYNDPKVLAYYERNGFIFLQTKGTENKENDGMKEALKTRPMFCDLFERPAMS